MNAAATVDTPVTVDTKVEYEAQREYSHRADEWFWSPISGKCRFASEQEARDRLKDQATNRWTRAYRVVVVTTVTITKVLQ